MGTITMSGFNSIDWQQVLTAVMTQERQPLKALETKQTNLESQQKALATLATKLATLESAASDLSVTQTAGGRSASSTNESAVRISAGSSALVGNYEVEVTALATAQVTTSTTVLTDKDTTTVATGGTLTIGGTTVTLDGPVTLSGLADAINSTTDAPARATVVQANGQFKLVLTGTETGAAAAFTIDTAGLSGGSTIAFSGTNAVNAGDASFTVNKVLVTSASNTITDAIPGATLTLQRQTTEPVTVSVTQDPSALKDNIKKFVTAYNDVVAFIDKQVLDARGGNAGTLGNDGILRDLRRSLNSSLLNTFEGVGSLKNLSQIGFEFQRTGQLGFKESRFDEVLSTNQEEVESLLSGVGATPGAFDAVSDAIGQYTDAEGLVPGARERITDQITAIKSRISAFEARLALRQDALLREYIAADKAISALNASVSSLSSLGTGYRLF